MHVLSREVGHFSTCLPIASHPVRIIYLNCLLLESASFLVNFQELITQTRDTKIFTSALFIMAKIKMLNEGVL